MAIQEGFFVKNDEEEGDEKDKYDIYTIGCSIKKFKSFENYLESIGMFM
jgi:hypothetical protein